MATSILIDRDELAEFCKRHRVRKLSPLAQTLLQSTWAFGPSQADPAHSDDPRDLIRRRLAG